MSFPIKGGRNVVSGVVVGSCCHPRTDLVCGDPDRRDLTRFGPACDLAWMTGLFLAVCLGFCTGKSEFDFSPVFCGLLEPSV